MQVHNCLRRFLDFPMITLMYICAIEFHDMELCHPMFRVQLYLSGQMELLCKQ